MGARTLSEYHYAYRNDAKYPETIAEEGFWGRVPSSGCCVYVRFIRCRNNVGRWGTVVLESFRLLAGPTYFEFVIITYLF